MYTKKPLTLMCVQPCIPYYAWQIEVMLHNFVEVGIPEKYNIHILFAYNIKESNWRENVAVIKKVDEQYKNIAQFFYYQDTRQYPISYISSIRPNLLKQHFSAEYLNISDAVFYHDCDIVFTKFPDFLEPLIDGNDWYVSDTRSYIGYNYIKSKGEDVLNEMCNIVGISPEIIADREEQSGGAQYLMKGVDYHFFNKMEIDCESLYKNITNLNNIKKSENPSHHELQIWCADMWAILWGAWLKGYETKVISEMDFCWATDHEKTWEEKYIFHNAGVTANGQNELFFKGNFRDKYPYLHECETYKKDSASYKYFQIIKAIGQKSCLL
jgi:hypothetical protein